jgi:hypothetical protein
MFTARCQLSRELKDRKRTVTWDAGELRGDPEAVNALIDRASDREHRLVGAVECPYTMTNHLQSDFSALTLVYEICAEQAPQMR